MTKSSDCKNILKESTSSHLQVVEEVDSRLAEVVHNRFTNKKYVKSSLWLKPKRSKLNLCKFRHKTNKYKKSQA